MILPLTLLGLAIAAYSCGQLQQHGKLRWSKKDSSFFGENSYLRKYKNKYDDKTKFQVLIPIRNLWYYDLFKVPYREAFPLSATLLVFVTDFYHLMQFFYNIFLSLSVALLIDISYFIWIWISVVLIHAMIYRICQR